MERETRLKSHEDTAISMWAWGLLCLLVAALIPLLLLGCYDYPSMDDYCYGIFPYRALLEGTSVPAAVWQTVTGYYAVWQGSFSALASMSLTPFVFNMDAYFLTPIVMIASLCIGTYKLMDTLVRRWLGGRWYHTVCLAVPILLLSLQCVENPMCTFYWWNGAVYYTFTYGIMLLFLERMVALCLAKGRREMLWAVIPGVVAAVFIGGSNFVSGLLSLLIGALFLVALLLRARRKAPYALLLFAYLAVAFLINVAAPGNAIRQATQEKMSIIQMIAASVLKGGLDVLSYPNWLSLLTFLLLIPILYRLVGGMKFSFPCPLLFSILSFLLFSAQNAPHFYATTTSGPDRLRSIIYYSFFWLVLLNLGYWLGWLRRVQTRRNALSGHVPRPLAKVKYLCMAVVGMGLVGSFFWYQPGLNSVRAATALSDGSAKAYAAQWEARRVLLEDPALLDVELEPFTVQPPLLYNGDILEDPTYWSNNVMRDFYQKERVVLAPVQPPE